MTLHCSLAHSLRDNKLGTEGWCAIFHALRDNPDNKIEAWDLSSEDMGSRAGAHARCPRELGIVKVLAEYISASAAVKSLKYACALHS